jgi:hypothetical protein
MVLTTAQTAAFFQEKAQMGTSNPNVAQMQAQGIPNDQDLADFDKESLQQQADNPNPHAAPGTTIPTPAFVFAAKSQR